MNSIPSPREDLNRAIESQNPFQVELVVTKQNVWEKELPDVASINAHASDTVFEAIDQVRIRQRQVAGVTIFADPGFGKTHIISRIRHRLQAGSDTLFVYMSEYSDLNRIKLEFLKTLAYSFKYNGSQGVMQWQELATALVNEAEGQNFTPKHLVETFPERLAADSNAIEDLKDRVMEVRPEFEDPDIVQAILWTLSKKHSPYAIKWLAGKSLPQSKADAMQLPNPSEEEKEAEAFDTIRQLLDIIGCYATIAICFDELDSPECNDAGFTRAQVAAGLAKTLYNSVKRGVLLMSLLIETWKRELVNTSVEDVTDASDKRKSAEVVELTRNIAANNNRISDIILELRGVNEDSILELVSLWLRNFYEQKGLIPHDPVYPFDREELRQMGKERPTARKILGWCKNNWKVPGKITPPIPDFKPLTRVGAALEQEIAQLDDEELLENESQIAKALIFGFNRLIGYELEGVKIEDIQAPVNPKNKYIHFNVVGQESGQPVKIGVAILQASGGTGLLAGLTHLANYQRYGLTRGCLVRSKQISQSAKKAQEKLNHLLQEQGGEWVSLKGDEVKPIVAIKAVYDKREDYELSEEQIWDFISSKKLAAENPLLLEILSDPSGQVPEDAVDEEAME